MRTTLFFCIALIALSKASQDVQVFAQLDQHPFGSSLLDLVQMNMQSNAQTEMKAEDSLDQITQLIATIATDMQTAKKTADSEYKSFQTKAAADIAQYKRVIAQQIETRKQTITALAAQKLELKNTQADLAAAQTLLKETVASIQREDTQNRKAIAAQAQKEVELREAIAACKEANVELGRLNGNSFIEGTEINMLQVQQGMRKVESALSVHLPSRLTVFKPIIQALIDMGTNADPALVKKVMGLINELRSALEAELAESIKIEATRLADYTKLRATLVNVQTNTEERIGRNLSLIKKLNKNIKISTRIINELNKTIPANQKLQAQREAEKKQNTEEYTKADASRVDELKVIDELTKYFETKFQKSMSTYMRNRVAQ